MILRVTHRLNKLQKHVSHISLMAKISVDCFVHTLHISAENNIEFIPFELAIVFRCRSDVICHCRH